MSPVICSNSVYVCGSSGALCNASSYSVLRAISLSSVALLLQASRNLLTARSSQISTQLNDKLGDRYHSGSCDNPPLELAWPRLFGELAQVVRRRCVCSTWLLSVDRTKMFMLVVLVCDSILCSSRCAPLGTVCAGRFYLRKTEQKKKAQLRRELRSPKCKASV